MTAGCLAGSIDFKKTLDLPVPGFPVVASPSRCIPLLSGRFILMKEIKTDRNKVGIAVMKKTDCHLPPLAKKMPISNGPRKAPQLKKKWIRFIVELTDFPPTFVGI
jgi:hypothetical protein